MKGVNIMSEERTLMSFDWALKSILRQKDNFDILEGFLSDLMNEQIEILNLLESESNQDDKLDKFNRVDLKAKDSTGREIIIEIQYDTEPDYIGRIYYGTCKTALENMKIGRRYADVKKIISVSIVYWKLLEESYLVKGSTEFKDLVNDKAIKIKREQNIFAEYYFIQPKWFKDNVRNKIDDWVYLFKHSEVRDGATATNINKAQDKLNKLNMTPKERAAYDEYEFNKTINEGVLQVREDKGRDNEREKFIEAMKKSGMSGEEIKRIIKLREEETE